jgi:AcrR family transcriptional regulator
MIEADVSHAGQYVVGFADLAPAVRIRETALVLFAEHGPQATSIRMIARAVGVSPGAILHHYPTKADIERAVRESVVARLRAAIRGVGEGEPTLLALRHRRERADAVVSSDPAVGGYLRHVYAAGGEGAAALFDEMHLLHAEEMERMVAAGLARPMPDPQIGLLVYRALTMATALLRPMIEQLLGQSLDDPEVRRRFRDAEIDLLTRPLFPIEH